MALEGEVETTVLEGVTEGMDAAGLLEGESEALASAPDPGMKVGSGATVLMLLFAEMTVAPEMWKEDMEDAEGVGSDADTDADTVTEIGEATGDEDSRVEEEDDTRIEEDARMDEDEITVRGVEERMVDSEGDEETTEETTGAEDTEGVGVELAGLRKMVVRIGEPMTGRVVEMAATGKLLDAVGRTELMSEMGTDPVVTAEVAITLLEPAATETDEDNPVGRALLPETADEGRAEGAPL